MILPRITRQPRIIRKGQQTKFKCLSIHTISLEQRNEAPTTIPYGKIKHGIQPNKPPNKPNQPYQSHQSYLPSRLSQQNESRDQSHTILQNETHAGMHIEYKCLCPFPKSQIAIRDYEIMQLQQPFPPERRGIPGIFLLDSTKQLDGLIMGHTFILYKVRWPYT
jgi:hypothetical protein